MPPSTKSPAAAKAPGLAKADADRAHAATVQAAHELAAAQGRKAHAVRLQRLARKEPAVRALLAELQLLRATLAGKQSAAGKGGE